jgi:hypothetical protein
MSETQYAAGHESAVSVTGTLELAKRAAQEGAADAREAAIRTWAATSQFVNRFVYTASYTISYGVVFPVVLVARAIPSNNAAVRGLIDGAEAARQRVDQIVGATPGTAGHGLGPAPALEST